MPGESQNLPATGQADPSILTTEQLLREVENAVKLLHAEMEGVKDVNTEKFESVGTQFKLIERQRVEQKADTEKAVAAALQAAKEAVQEQTAASDKSITKSETATAEQLKQLTATFTTAIGGVTAGLDDVKDRVGNIEALKQGATESRSEQRLDLNSLIPILSLIAIVVFFFLAR